MNIGELSRRSGVSPRSLRYYEKHGLIHAERRGNGYREYDDSAVERASVIHTMFGLGFARPVVESVLTCTGEAPASVHREVAQQLIAVRNDMADRIVQLSHTHRLLSEFIDASV